MGGVLGTCGRVAAAPDDDGGGILGTCAQVAAAPDDDGGGLEFFDAAQRLTDTDYDIKHNDPLVMAHDEKE